MTRDEAKEIIDLAVKLKKEHEQVLEARKLTGTMDMIIDRIHNAINSILTYKW